MCFYLYNFNCNPKVLLFGFRFERTEGISIERQKMSKKTLLFQTKLASCVFKTEYKFWIFGLTVSTASVASNRGCCFLSSSTYSCYHGNSTPPLACFWFLRRDIRVASEGISHVHCLRSHLGHRCLYLLASNSLF